MEDPGHLPPSQPGRTIVLIAEDEPMVRNLARMVLEEEGYFVLAASNGEEALSLSRQFSGTIHALLSDVKMPKLDGLELRKTILSERPGIKVMLISGYTERLAENIPILLKPFDANVLKRRMRDLLAMPRLSQPD